MTNLRFLTLAMLVLGGCASDPGDDGDDEDGTLEPVVPQPSRAACDPSARIHCFAQVRTDAQARIASFTTPAGFGATELQQVYHLNAAKAPVATIVIVDAYDYPTAEADLAAYRTQYGLPPCTSASGCFTKLNQSGAATPLPQPSPAGDDWSLEAALDLDMASAACPSCKIVLLEADDDASDGLFFANDTAATLHATVVSNSWGAPEWTGVTAYETHFTHPGIAYFASSGDNGNNDGGAGPLYPSTSRHVIAVGGTTLQRSTNTRGYAEKVWSGAGSSCSKSFSRPSWQTAVAGCSKRMASDVSAVADPNTGVAVYNSAYNGWIVVGGTSAASPLVAGIYARYGLGAATAQYGYAHPTQFFDVKSGKNGTCTTALCRAGTGWDGPTGIGTPNGQKL